MPRRARSLLRPLAVALPCLAMTVGGWAVATVESLPDHLVAGKATPLNFIVRQHGHSPLDGVRPVVELVSGTERVRVDAEKAGGAGRYTARVVAPHAGAWTLTLRHGWGNGSVTLPPITAVRAGEIAPAVADGERGHRLFAAKGCVVCHVDVKSGPDLAGRRYDAAWLARYLADPQRVRPAPDGRPQMPTLGLDTREIASLVAYVNGGQIAAR